jgi:hypothetical protein
MAEAGILHIGATIAIPPADRFRASTQRSADYGGHRAQRTQSGQQFIPDAEMLMGEGPATPTNRAPIVVRLALLGTLSESITGTRRASGSLG